MVDKFGEWGVKIAEHLDTLEFFFCNEVELFFDISGKTVIYDLIEMIGEKV